MVFFKPSADLTVAKRRAHCCWYCWRISTFKRIREVTSLVPSLTMVAQPTVRAACCALQSSFLELRLPPLRAVPLERLERREDCCCAPATCC